MHENNIISASCLCQLWMSFLLFDVKVVLNRLPLVALGVYPIVFIRFYCVVGAVSKLEVIDCTQGAYFPNFLWIIFTERKDCVVRVQENKIYLFLHWYIDWPLWVSFRCFCSLTCTPTLNFPVKWVQSKSWR